MNILPKKRWHVRTKDNIARVRKDEAAAHEEERKKQAKFKLAESEARVSLLRKRSGLLEKQDEERAEKNTAEVDAISSQHFNLFANYKAHVKTNNKELEKEKKEEQEKYEKKIGFLTYLGQDTNEALRLKSWYEVAPKRLAIRSDRAEINEKDLKIKKNHDPLTLINGLLQSDRNSVAEPILKRNRSPSPRLTKEKLNCPKLLKKRKKERKHHKRRKHTKNLKKYSHKSEKQKDEILKHLKLEQLRKERIRRETTERARQDALLAPQESRKATEIPSCTTPKIIQKYNSQFNPELAKQNIN